MTEFVGQAGEIFAAVLSALGVLRLLQLIYRRSVGRRKDEYRRLSRLGTNAQLSFFTEVLGERPAMSRTIAKDGYQEHAYVSENYFVHVVTDDDESVVAFSVTARTQRFKPRLRSPGSYYIEEKRSIWRRIGEGMRLEPIFDVRLGDPFSTVTHSPEKIYAHLGANRFAYWEAHWLGNPGNYQWYVFAINDVGALSAVPPFRETILRDAWMLDWGEDPFSESNSGSLREPEGPRTAPQGLPSFREHARINTYSVIGPALHLADYPRDYFGPDQAWVRTLP